MSGLDPIVLSGVSTVWLLSYLRKSVHVRDISALSDVISAYSFLMLIIFCLCLLICLGSFLISNVSVLIPFVLSSLFIDVFNSAYSALSFCCNHFLF